MNAEFKARRLYYWSKIRQALKAGELTTAAEWFESAGHAEGPEMTKELKTLSSQLCRGLIDR